MVERAGVRVHPTAEVSPNAVIGPGTSVWNQAQVREDARIGAGCIIGKNVYVDAGVVVGDRVKIQNNVSVFRGVTVEDGVFVGPHVCFTNDRVPRAINRDGSPKTDDDWEVTPDPGAFRGRARREQHDPARGDDRPLGDGRRRQRRHARRGRPRARGRQPCPAARQRLCRAGSPLRDAAGRHGVRRPMSALRDDDPVGEGCEDPDRGRRPAAVRQGRAGQSRSFAPSTRSCWCIPGSTTTTR